MLQVWVALTEQEQLGGWHHYLDRLEEALGGLLVNHDQPEQDYAAREVPGRPE